METIDDPKLSELLGEWRVEGAPGSLDMRVMGEWRNKRWTVWRSWSFPFVAWKGLLAGGSVAAIVFLIAISSAYPQSAHWLGIQLDRPSWTLESDEIFYAADGSEPREYSQTDLLVEGRQISLSGDQGPNRPFWREAMMGLDVTLATVMLRVAPSAVIPAMSPAGHAGWRRLVESGCVAEPRFPAMLLGHETLLGHPTTINQFTVLVRRGSKAGVLEKGGTKIRITSWMASDMDCVVLKSTLEREGPDGQLHPSRAKVPVKITANGVRGGVALKK